ncbi:MAG: hypothetical protein J6B26_03925 [Agathobacter sp.]|nr:hypothetical protein [Agathobacter sp.]
MSWKYRWEKNKLQIKMLIFALLLVAFIINLIVIGVQKSESKKEREASERVEETCVPESGTQVPEENVPESGTQVPEENVPESGTQMSEENVPESGTVKIISNLEEYAAPILQGKETELEKGLCQFLIDQNRELTTAEIFYLMIPEENPESVKFFLKLSESGELIEMLFDRTSGTVDTSICEYTEEEIFAEVWEGEQPECRDIEE